MGGQGSGRRQIYERRTTDGVLSIDIAALGRKGALQPWHRSAVNWARDGLPIGSIGLLALPDGLQLSFRVHTAAGTWQDVQQLIQYLSTATPFGRPRRWFQCPGCNRRCRVLYGGERFRCRQCHGLKYESQFESPAQRANRASRKIRRRLGGGANLMEEFPPRPCGMHRTTYERLEALDDDMQSVWVRSVFKLIGRSRS
jgi:hypothetical protein